MMENTHELRWYHYKDPETGAMFCNLQQRWADIMGNEEWRDIPSTYQKDDA